MSDETRIPPLPDDVAALLRRAPRPLPPPGFTETVRSRVKSTLQDPGSPPGAGGAAPSTGGPGTAALSRALGQWGVASAITALAAGGLLGWWANELRHRDQSDRQPVVLTQRPPVVVAPSVPVPDSLPAPEINEPSRPESPPPAVPPKAPTKAAAPRLAEVLPLDGGVRVAPIVPAHDAQLAEERSLIDIARSALDRREASNALAALESHAKRFPNGQLVEERESLLVLALASAGRHPEARAHATEFARRFPHSLLLPVVEAAITEDGG